MNEVVLNYPDFDVIVIGTRMKDCIRIPKSQLPNGLFPNGRNEMFKEGEIYKIESIHRNHIVSFIVCFILILLGIFLIVFQKMNNFQELETESRKIISDEF